MGIPHSKKSLSLLMVWKDCIERYMREKKKKKKDMLTPLLLLLQI
jgi:hypothetical protein